MRFIPIPHFPTDRSKAALLLQVFFLCASVVPVLVLLFVVYSTRRFVLCLTLCHFVLVFFSPLSIAITCLGGERANLSACSICVCLDLLVSSPSWKSPGSVTITNRSPSQTEGLRFVIVALPGLFSYLYIFICGIYVDLIYFSSPLLSVLWVVGWCEGVMYLLSPGASS